MSIDKTNLGREKMCNICMRTVCPASCPNSDYPRMSCENCGAEINPEEEYLEFGDCYICEDCADREMTARDLARVIRPLGA